MSWLLLATASHAHDLDDLVRRADETLAGPFGCFAASGEVRWRHEAGGWTDEGTAELDARFDHRVWRVDRFEVAGGGPTRLAPMMLGTTSAAPLAYWETRRRWFQWPAPVVTIPMRTWGEIGTVSIDEHDGLLTVAQGFAWEGYKRAEGVRRVALREGVPVRVELEVTDRRPGGCRIETTGQATLDGRGLPDSETWTFEGRCPLRRWTHTWTFTWGDWSRC